MWGIALEPFCAPVRNGSSASRTSVRWRWRISVANASIVAPSDAQAYSTSAWRSRASTCVDGTGVRPRRLHTYSSIAGSTLLYVPTAPESFPTAITSRADTRRRRSRRSWSAHSAILAPNVVGSAWMPCVRPTIGVSRNSRAAGRDRGLERVDRLDDQVEGARHRDRQRGVDDVARREAVVDPGAVGRTDVRLHHVDEGGDVVVGHLLALVDLGHREGGALADRARGIRRARPRGVAQASTARISTSSHTEKRASSEKRSAMAGSE